MASASPGTILHTYVAPGFQRVAEAAMGACGVQINAHNASSQISFSYTYPLARPEIDWDDHTNAAIKVSGGTVLRFGMIEGEAVVDAARVVYDPQSSGQCFQENGSKSECLATVMNDVELADMSGTTDVAAGASWLLASGRPNDVLIVKRGPLGAEVYRSGVADPEIVPAYRSAKIFKIGSGDVFSAMFALHWGERGLPPVEAADLASRAVATYVQSASLPVPDTLGPESHGPPLPTGIRPGTIYLAAPFFTLGQRWLVEEARKALLALGASVFSPVHDVGFGPPETVAPADIAGLNACGAVLAVLDGGDPGTIYEIGHARSRGIPVVVLAESVMERDLTMPIGMGCEIAPDLTAAAYMAVWAAMR
ncbi:nucleoside 2-deoxyribosyltransferase [Azospirillum sp. YIM DDC1]|uniref:Nucleoside 2-deoxyribosyltransferase n=1 Tax=Azospirillum aestuarii TaxID=2802052 RepID=A0ABS1I7N5_9PROT|nr:nucleoside 2-deoxyribosyltransferase [Azospirillum aestuarii]